MRVPATADTLIQIYLVKPFKPCYYYLRRLDEAEASPYIRPSKYSFQSLA